uniref:Dynein light intermediate chain n=1 Tax=Laticauda laticaudata TaxID=8630 RepID=A0A8C5SN99_LATLA
EIISLEAHFLYVIFGIEEYKKGRGMEYLYLNVHDEDRDDQTRCNVWILDGDLYHKGLLKFAIEATSLKDTLIMMVVDMSKPWTALNSLQKWASVVREHIDKLKILPEEMKEMEQKGNGGCLLRSPRHTWSKHLPNSHDVWWLQ